MEQNRFLGLGMKFPPQVNRTTGKRKGVGIYYPDDTEDGADLCTGVRQQSAILYIYGYQ